MISTHIHALIHKRMCTNRNRNLRRKQKRSEFEKKKTLLVLTILYIVSCYSFRRLFHLYELAGFSTQRCCLKILYIFHKIHMINKNKLIIKNEKLSAHWPLELLHFFSCVKMECAQQQTNRIWMRYCYVYMRESCQKSASEMTEKLRELHRRTESCVKNAMYSVCVRSLSENICCFSVQFYFSFFFFDTTHAHTLAGNGDGHREWAIERIILRANANAREPAKWEFWYEFGFSALFWVFFPSSFTIPASTFFPARSMLRYRWLLMAMQTVPTLASTWLGYCTRTKTVPER